MPTEDYSNKTRISRIRENVVYLGKSKAGNSVSSSAYTSRALGDVPIKIKNSSGISIVNRSTDSSGPPTLLSLTYAGSNYISPCNGSNTRSSMTMTITARFNRPIISASSSNPPLNFTINGNTATVILPNGGRCTDSTDSSMSVAFTVDGIYTVNGVLVIPANT
jgi:hypothetical protein